MSIRIQIMIIVALLFGLIVSSMSFGLSLALLFQRSCS